MERSTVRLIKLTDYELGATLGTGREVTRFVRSRANRKENEEQQLLCHKTDEEDRHNQIEADRPHNERSEDPFYDRPSVCHSV